MVESPRAGSPFRWAATGVTLLGLGFAVAAASLAVSGRDAEAFALLVAAGLADLFDGWVARRTGHAGSALGVQLDSVVDMASFGVVPLVLVFAVGDASPGALEVAIGWIYAACAALRLARFNTEAGSRPEPARRYRGLPVTYAALGARPPGLEQRDDPWNRLAVSTRRILRTVLRPHVLFRHGGSLLGRRGDRSSQPP